MLLAASVCAGCGGGDEERELDRAELRHVVLKTADLPRSWILFEEGPHGPADVRSESRAEADRFGRVGGWKARFRQPPAERDGPLVVSSDADLFETADGATQELETLEQELSSGAFRPGAELLAAPDLGDEAIVYTVEQRGGAASPRLYGVAWRRANVTATLDASGFDGRFTLADTLALVRKQDARLVRELRD